MGAAGAPQISMRELVKTRRIFMEDVYIAGLSAACVHRKWWQYPWCPTVVSVADTTENVFNPTFMICQDPSFSSVSVD